METDSTALNVEKSTNTDHLWVNTKSTSATKKHSFPALIVLIRGNNGCPSASISSSSTKLHPTSTSVFLKKVALWTGGDWEYNFQEHLWHFLNYIRYCILYCFKISRLYFIFLNHIFDYSVLLHLHLIVCV